MGGFNAYTKIVCVYCKGDHFSTSCESFPDTKRWKEVLRKNKRCFLCLSQGHKVSQCTSKRKCNRRHHQSICETGVTGQNTTLLRLTQVAHPRMKQPSQL